MEWIETKVKKFTSISQKKLFTVTMFQLTL